MSRIVMGVGIVVALVALGLYGASQSWFGRTEWRGEVTSVERPDTQQRVATLAEAAAGVGAPATKRVAERSVAGRGAHEGENHAPEGSISVDRFVRESVGSPPQRPGPTGHPRLSSGANDLRKDKRLNMQAIIPLAGKGTRVRPHTHTRPKPLLRVANRPVLSYVVEQLKSVGVDHVVAITGHLAPQIEDYFSGGAGLDVTFAPAALGFIEAALKHQQGELPAEVASL